MREHIVEGVHILKVYTNITLLQTWRLQSWHKGDCFILLRLNPLSQRKLPIVISLSRMLCFGRESSSPCALNVSAALRGAYITPFPTEVVRAIRTQRDEAYVSKIVCCLHIMASNPHPPPWCAPHLHHFHFTSPCMRFSLRFQCKRCSAGCLQLLRISVFAATFRAFATAHVG